MLGCELLRGQGFPDDIKIGGSFVTTDSQSGEQSNWEIPDVSDTWLMVDVKFSFVSGHSFWVGCNPECRRIM